MVGYLNQDLLDLTENKYDIFNEGVSRIFSIYLQLDDPIFEPNKFVFGDNKIIKILQ